MRVRRFVWIYLSVSFVLGVLAGAAVAQMALDHNPQETYCDYIEPGEPGRGHIWLNGYECRIVFDTLVPLVLIGATAVWLLFVAPLAVAAAVVWTFRRLGRGRGRSVNRAS